MRRFLLPMLSFFLIIWLFGGAVWYAQQEQQQQQQILVANGLIPPFHIADSNFVLRVAENISFFQSNYEAHIPESVNLALQQLSEYLSQHPHKEILLSGSFIAGEANHSSYENLGVARAEAIKSRLIRLGLNGDRMHTLGQLEAEMNFREGVVFGAVQFDFKD